MRDENSRERITALERRMGHFAGDVWSEDGCSQIASYNSGLVETVYDLKIKLRKLEAFLGVEYTSQKPEYRKIKKPDARPNPSKS